MPRRAPRISIQEWRRGIQGLLAAGYWTGNWAVDKDRLMALLGVVFPHSTRGTRRAQIGWLTSWIGSAKLGRFELRTSTEVAAKRAAIGKGTAGQRFTPEAHDRLVEAVRAANARPEVIRRRAEAQRRAWANPVHRALMVERARQRALRPEERARRSEIMRRVVTNPKLMQKRLGAVRRYWSDPANRNKQIEWHRQRMADPANRQLAAEGARRQMSNLELRRRIAEINRERMKNPEARRAVAERVRQALANPEVRRKMSEAQTRRFASPEARIQAGIQGKKAMSNPESRRRVGEASKRRWTDPDWAAKTTLAARRGAHARPTRPERTLWEMLSNLAPNEWGYNGDGRLGVTIARKIPDFVSNKTKSVIELFGEYYHRGEDPQARIEQFARQGYRCLVVWANELRDRERLKSTLRSFIAPDIQQGTAAQRTVSASPPRSAPFDRTDPGEVLLC